MEVRVYGNIDSFIGSSINADSLIGKPITDNDGRQIGVIEGVDSIIRNWYGVVFSEKDILRMVEENRERSMEIDYGEN